ncbi:TOPRIM nucleotidyl transferase/hydrolase domain-containing protein [Micromonospora sp. NPDC007271]|uniref:TOPRIM nucleotidyl transferase/hydrolase domain-containing protein n=1 Tax=Micromonospora sp. NPDC007271 TaxID=3154587 RepID=UPI0033D32B9C
MATTRRGETLMDATDRRELAREVLDGRLGGNAASIRATARALAKVESAVAVVLVEGISDQIALETAAAGRGRDLEAERVVIVPIGGAHAIGRFLTRLGPLGTRVRLAGLCDLREEEVFRRGLDGAQAGSPPGDGSVSCRRHPEITRVTPRTRAEMEQLGFYVCVRDLEDELIRAVGTAGVEEVFDSQGDLRSFRLFQSQPAWRGRKPEAQLHRFVRSSSRRNLRYARLFVEAAVGRDTLPRPLDALLTAV